jgi:hypothetical protein
MRPLFESGQSASAYRAFLAAALGVGLVLAGHAAVAQEAEIAPLEETVEDEEAYKKLIEELSKSQSAKGGNQFCAVIVSSDGQLAPSPEADELSSTSYGGRAGQAEVVASNSSYTLAIDAPLGFSLAPSGANDSLVMKASYSGFGATSFSMTPGNIPVRLKQGSTTLSINLEATKTNSLFPAGQYRAEIVLRCE